jgi:hypothetical protein
MNKITRTDPRSLLLLWEAWWIWAQTRSQHSDCRELHTIHSILLYWQIDPSSAHYVQHTFLSIYLNESS